jgi:hypothetical protein
VFCRASAAQHTRFQAAPKSGALRALTSASLASLAWTPAALGSATAAAVRLAPRSHVEGIVRPVPTGALFFVLAFSMILPRRIALDRRYRQLVGAAAPPG